MTAVRKPILGRIRFRATYFAASLFGVPIKVREEFLMRMCGIDPGELCSEGPQGAASATEARRAETSGHSGIGRLALVKTHSTT